MHIAFLTSEYPDFRKPEGGLGTYIRKASQELVQRGHSATIFVLAPKNDQQVDHEVPLQFVKRKRFHWRLHQIAWLHPWLDLWQDRINASRLRRAVYKLHKVHKIDVLQTPNYKAPGLALCHNGIFPIVCRCSSYQPLLRSANGSRKSLPEAIGDWWEARQLSEAEAAFSPSEFIAHTYERFEAVRPVIIRTPVDFTPVNRDPSIYLEIGEGKKYLLYFGALNGVKGLDLLIQALPSVLSTNKDLSFILIGRNDPLPGGERALDLLQNNLKELMDEQRLIYLPSLPKSQLYPIIEHALGVIMPSRVDNYPNACLEALSLGVPVVGTYESSLDEMVEEGKTGFLAKNGDPTSLAHAIERLLNLSPSQRETMIENIRRQIESINKEDRVGQLISFYEKTIRDFKQAG